MKSCLAFLIILVTIIAGGTYVASRWNAQRIARNLATATEKVMDYRVTIIEGKRREEIGRLLEGKGVCGYEEFMTASSDKEGMLFPDTYRFFKNTPAKEVVKKMTDTFAIRTETLNPTINQINLAAIVEREAQGDTDRALIAGIYINRLTQGMTLDADPTVQYAKDTAITPTTYWGPITQADYSGVTSLYNTYLHKGLPPTPIANPGLPSLQAAVHPTKNPYLYFLHKNGTLIPARTLDEQQSHE